jgi:hypothetical protein
MSPEKAIGLNPRKHQSTFVGAAVGAAAIAGEGLRETKETAAAIFRNFFIEQLPVKWALSIDGFLDNEFVSLCPERINLDMAGGVATLRCPDLEMLQIGSVLANPRRIEQELRC